MHGRNSTKSLAGRGWVFHVKHHGNRLYMRQSLCSIYFGLHNVAQKNNTNIQKSHMNCSKIDDKKAGSVFLVMLDLSIAFDTVNHGRQCASLVDILFLWSGTGSEHQWVYVRATDAADGYAPRLRTWALQFPAVHGSIIWYCKEKWMWGTYVRRWYAGLSKVQKLH